MKLCRLFRPAATELAVEDLSLENDEYACFFSVGNYGRPLAFGCHMDVCRSGVRAVI